VVFDESFKTPKLVWANPLIDNEQVGCARDRRALFGLEDETVVWPRFLVACSADSLNCRQLCG
jgi:hypothetical protein